jgi:7-cyano-7-deazaguanine synthase in queuosine biosynthesis
MKKCLIFFSGGIDSTYLLIKNLELNNYIYPVYLDIDGINPTQKEQELLAIDKILFELKNHNQIHAFKNFKLSWLATMQPIQMPQMFITWAWHIAMLGSYYDNGGFDEVQLAYCLNDCAVSYIKQMENLWDSFTDFIGLENKYDSFPHDRVPPKLYFPLTAISKSSMVAYLSDKYPNILKNCWWCENPHISEDWEIERFGFPEGVIPCGKCPSCRRMSGENLLELFTDKAILFYDKARKEYNNLGKNVPHLYTPKKVDAVEICDKKETLQGKLKGKHMKVSKKADILEMYTENETPKEALKGTEYVEVSKKRKNSKKGIRGIKDIDIESIR